MKSLFWNGVIRLIIEAYFDILLCLGVTYCVLTSDKATDIIPIEMSLPGVTLSKTFAIILLLVCVGTPIFIAVFYLKNSDRWE